MITKPYMTINGYQFIQEARDHVPSLDLLIKVSASADGLYFNVDDTPENNAIIDDVLAAHIIDENFDPWPIRLEEAQL